MDNSLKVQYEFLEETFILSKTTLLLAKKLYCDYARADKTTKEMLIIFINALFHSAAVNICRLLDRDDNGINIYKFLTAYCEAKSAAMELALDFAAVERLRKRRNKALVHADKKLLNPNFSNDIPLYISDLDSVLASVEKLLCFVAKGITGESVDLDVITRQIEVRYDSYTDMISKNTQIWDFMKQNHPKELYSIIYSTKEINNDGQTEDKGTVLLSGSS